jgi:tyrosinase
MHREARRPPWRTLSLALAVLAAVISSGCSVSVSLSCQPCHRPCPHPCPPPCPGTPPEPPGEGSVEIQINNTAEDTDDYLTWAPTFCRARSADGTKHDVVLTNDPPGDIPTGGDVLFATDQSPWPPNTTATADSVALSLPASGAWVPFVIAGKFGKPSIKDRDAVIDVHSGSDVGPVFAKKAAMVRVRKDAEKLTAEERDLFLRAINDLNLAGGYAPLQAIHGVSSNAGNEAHQQPAFGPWHRAMILQFERALQGLKPEYRAVTCPYWNWEAPSPKLFSQDFLGEGNVDGGVNFFSADEVKFSATNPIKDWDTGIPAVRIRRLKFDHTVLPRLDPTDVTSNPFRRLHGGLTPLLDRTEFGGASPFSQSFEFNPHNVGHGWNCGGGHLINPANATRDPLFFFLHCSIDHLWAAWQNHHDRAGAVVGGVLTFTAPGDYSNTGNWDDVGVVTLQQGSFLEDEMWPWDGTSGGAGRAQRPVGAPSVPLPASAIQNLWPPAPAKPRVRDMIDYLGRGFPTDGLGFCYDDVPYARGLPGIPLPP